MAEAKTHQENLSANKAAAIIKKKVPNFTPKLGIILGSGLSELANLIKNPQIISYQELPDFARCGVEGHPGNLYLGELENYPVACLQGRAHLYEGISSQIIQTLVRTLKLMGCEILLLTNAAGSLRADMPTGSIMLITDHINFQFDNPLAGANDARFGPRFISMQDAYDPHLRKRMLTIANNLQIPLAQGVYIGVLGPSFETPAEIRAFRILGADAVGMSTVAETIVARHCDLKVIALSAITNMAADVSDVKLSHEQTLAGAKLSTKNLLRLISSFAASLKNE